MSKLKKQKNKILISISVILILIICILIWFFQFKKPHDEAVLEFNNAVSIVSTENIKLDSAINSAQAIIDSGKQPYDPNIVSELTIAISDSATNKRTIPQMPKKTADILDETVKLMEPLDYSSYINNLSTKVSALENSIKQMEQITNPSSDFIVQRIQDIENISGMQAVTEDHDPNGKLNKAGGYTATVYFSSSLINQDEINGTDIIEKGTSAGGCIEVYATVNDAEKRNTYLSSFDGSVFDSGSHTILGTIVIRTSTDLTATQQNEITADITDKLIEIQ